MASPITIATIPANGTVSNSIPLAGMSLVGVSCPTITSSNLGIAVSSDGGATFQTLITDSTGPGSSGAYLLLPASSTGAVYVAIDPRWTYGADYIQLVAGSSQSSGAVAFKIHLRQVQ